MSKYTFEKLRIHSDSILKESCLILKQSKKDWDDAILAFSIFFEKISNAPKSLEKNVKMLISCRFFNHILSSLSLAERGLLVDAVICERSAIETLASFKLISANPKLAENYNNEDFFKPVEVRKKLEKLGYTEEVKNIRSIYASASRVTHINRDHERFSMKWEDINKGCLYIGGNFDKTNIKHMIEFLPALIHWFIMPLNNK